MGSERAVYRLLIAELDEVLAEARLAWMACANAAGRVRTWERIDRLLCLRLRLMARRDGTEATK